MKGFVLIMANNDVKNANIPESVKRDMATLRQAPVMHNILNLIPSECSWYIEASDMEKYVLKVADEFLGSGEVRMVTIDPGYKSSAVPTTCIWLKKDSKHLVDNTKSNGSQMVITPHVDKFSEQLKRFCDQFAPQQRDDGTPISRKKRIVLVNNANQSGDRSIIGVRIDLTRVIARIFDVENRSFSDTYGADTPARRCNLNCKAIYNKNDDRPRLIAIRVTKRFDDMRGDRRNSRPIPSFKNNRNDDDYRNDD